jgi:diguanylate cyclase (GGDEF)-like protein/PAS domain S-box-containing protein
MFGRLLATIRSEKNLSIDIRAHLVDGLFHPFASFVSGVIIGVAIAVLMWYFTDDPIVREVSYLLAAIAIARLVLGFIYLRRDAPITKNNVNIWEIGFSAGATAFSLCMGILTYVAIMRITNTEVHLILSITCAGYGSIIAARNAGRPWLALAQLYCATVPMWVALGLQEQYSQLVGSFGWSGLLLYTIGVSDITLAMRKTIVDALERKQENEKLAQSFEEQNKRFNAALTNMSHGICMFNENAKLIVWNDKAAEIVGLDPSLFHEGASINDVLQAFQPDEQQKILDQISDKANNLTEVGESSKLSDGRFIATSARTMDNGHIVIVFADVTEKERAQARIKDLAWVDQLTGLMNRVSLHEFFTKSLSEMGEADEIAVHYVDLDHFKSVNDTLGHPIGDLLLKQVAERIRDVCLDEGHVARMAGDEFLIVHKLSPQARTPRDLAQQVVDALRQPFNVNSHFIQIGASVGIVIAPKDGRDADLLLKRADMALYAAKKSGRNKFAYFEPQMDQRLQQVRALELDIKQALERRQFKLAFQPIVNAETRQISSFECLVRWTHPTQGRMMPGHFIPVAEETGQIIDIGRWVTKEAIRIASSWPIKKQISVNFSAVQFQDSRFAQYLNSQLKRYKFPPELLELEITETAFIVDLENSLKQLQQLKDLGIKISLDDFGTGYTSLSQLQRFSFNKIKIDGSFIRDIETNPSSSAVATAIAEIGKALKILVVAECVETEEQLEFLRSVGVTHIQGYLTGKPMDQAEAEALMLEENSVPNEAAG